MSQVRIDNCLWIKFAPFIESNMVAYPCCFICFLKAAKEQNHELIYVSNTSHSASEK